MDPERLYKTRKLGIDQKPGCRVPSARLRVFKFRLSRDAQPLMGVYIYSEFFAGDW